MPEGKACFVFNNTCDRTVRYYTTNYFMEKLAFYWIRYAIGFFNLWEAELIQS
ncbi:hypothetical protein BMETH_3748452021162, partial [methanotrophic bacterial endosymbiont of Bathymodiolus sp.]